MQNPHDISAEELARLFYTYRDLLAADFGFQGSEGSVAWEQISPEHRNLMVASARLALRQLTQQQIAPDNFTSGLQPPACA
jgi:hypothetical protein